MIGEKIMYIYIKKKKKIMGSNVNGKFMIWYGYENY
jgi:hypothetical protein